MAMRCRELAYANLLDVARAIADREVRSVEVTEHLLSRIDLLEPRLHAYARICREAALSAADAADKEIDGGLHRGPLHGVPIAVKDLIDTRDHVTASGTRLFADWVPEEDATVVARLKRAGAVIIAKAQMTEGAMIAHHPDIAPPRNPWAEDRSAGFSSSGSGVSVAAGLCYAALGSDTGGSIRIPSAMNGTTGLKPTWGRVSRHGVFPLTEYIDTVGPLARTAADAAAVLGVIAGADPGDPTAAPVPVPDYLSLIGQGISGVRIGFDPAALEGLCEAQVLAVLQTVAAQLSDLGADVRPIAIPSFDVMAMFPLLAAGVGDAHRATFPARESEYGPSLRGMLEYAATITGMDVAAAINHVNGMKGALDRLFTDVDMLLLPVLTVPTPQAGDMETMMGEEPSRVLDILRYMAPFNFSGHPCIALQGGIDGSGLPVGFQLVGRHFDEAMLLRAGHAFQRISSWHGRHPSFA